MQTQEKRQGKECWWSTLKIQRKHKKKRSWEKDERKLGWGTYNSYQYFGNLEQSQEPLHRVTQEMFHWIQLTKAKRKANFQPHSPGVPWKIPLLTIHQKGKKVRERGQVRSGKRSALSLHSLRSEGLTRLYTGFPKLLSIENWAGELNGGAATVEEGQYAQFGILLEVGISDIRELSKRMYFLKTT